MQFGPKSERLPEEQLQLGLEALEQAIANGEAEAEKRRLASCARTAALAGSEPRRPAGPAAADRGDAGSDDTACPCCRAAMTVIGEDKSERLDVIPGAVPGDRDPATEVRLSNLCRYCGAGARAGALLD